MTEKRFVIQSPGGWIRSYDVERHADKIANIKNRWDEYDVRGWKIMEDPTGDRQMAEGIQRAD